MLLDHLGEERNSEMFLRSGDPVPLLETCCTEGPGGARRFVSKNVPRRGKRPNVYNWLHTLWPVLTADGVVQTKRMKQ